MTGPNWFEGGGQAYAAFRPEYPPELAAHLAGLAPGRGLALDAGCGSGQLTVQLAGHFERVIGVDPSADQLAHAARHDRVSYLCAPAEAIPLDVRADLITAAQAAHWFDLPAFYAEARRLAAPEAVIALVSYGVLRLDPELDAPFARFYRDGIGPYWPPERALVDGGYRGIDFPFAELPAPALSITRDWDLAGFLGYLSTWSAVRRAREAGQEHIPSAFADEIATLWGPGPRRVTWPLNARIGTA